MQIIIPMTGYGSRFVGAGYKDLKPFIKVDGIPMIEWIVRGMFSSDDTFLFVCREEHLRQYPWMRDTLLSLNKHTEVFAIDDWVKKGPVYDVLRAKERIDDAKPCVINYCDFYMVWDYETYKKELSQRKCAGSVPCYTGFHPHLLIPENVYASCLTDSNDNLIEIREKFSFEQDKQRAKHSPGTYYFSSGAYLKKYCQLLVDSENSINGEYYASLPYNAMVQDGLEVWCPCNVEYFCQWGTPEDVKEYSYWMNWVKGKNQQ